MKPVRAKKSLGQHFLKDPNIIRKIVDAVHATEPKVVLEVGPGTGVLTKLMAPVYGDDFYAIEVDRESIEYLNENIPEIKDRIINENFLKFELDQKFSYPLTIAGNLPYNISSQIFFKVLDHRDLVTDVICMIQKEVAERMRATHGNKIYGILSVIFQSFYDVEYLFTVGPKVFNPPPKVNSAVIHMRRNDKKELACDEELFFKVVKLSFNQRRKTLRNSLKTILVNLDVSNPVFNQRPEQLSKDEFVDLTNLISQLKKEQ